VFLTVVFFIAVRFFMWFFVYFCRLYGSYVRCVMYRFYTVCVSFILSACPGFCTLSASRDDAAGPGDLLRFSRLLLCGVTRVIGRRSRGPVTPGSLHAFTGAQGRRF
jgi:hypothetical protein